MSNLSLVTLLMESTAKYVSTRIYYSKDKDSYLSAMRLCLTLCKNIKNDDFKSMKDELVNFRGDAAKSISNFEIFTNSKKFYLLGVDNSIDILDSFINRFDKEHSSPDSVFVQTLLERSKIEG